MVRRVRPFQRKLKKLTVLEKKTGQRYSITVTNIHPMRGIDGSPQIQLLDVLTRDHTDAEDRIRTNKAMELINHVLGSRQYVFTTRRGAGGQAR